MASIHQRPRSPYWHASFLAPDGRWTLRSTKCEDRTKALSVALEFERAAKLGRAGNLVEAQARKVVADIMARAGGEETLRAPSVNDFLNQWLTNKVARKSKGTSTRYGVAVTDFLASLGNRTAKPLTSLTTGDVERFLNYRTDKGLAPQTLVLDIKIIGAALNHARRQGIITTNPAEAVELPKGKSMERGTFTPAEVKMLVDTAKGEWKTLILLAYFTGARMSDCCRMAWADVDLGAATLTYTQAKTGEKVTMPIHTDLLAHLNKLAGTDKPEVFLMPHTANLKSGGRKGLSETFKRIMRDAGLDAGKVKKAGLRQLSRRTFHALRHSFNSAMANAGVSQEVRMKLTGHKTESVNRGYTHHELEPLRAAVKKIPSLG
ncbi:MAG: tyrosine-type recombinase/integrase [Limisphaerales bacterium]